MPAIATKVGQVEALDPHVASRSSSSPIFLGDPTHPQLGRRPTFGLLSR